MPLSVLLNRFSYSIVSLTLLALISIAPPTGLMTSAWAERLTGQEAAQKAQQQYQQGDLNGALATLDGAIAIEPTYQLYVLRAQARMAAKKFDGVIEDADTILADRPGDLAGVNLKLVALAQQEKLAEAIDFIDRHIANKPDVAKFPSSKAELLAALILQGDEAIMKHLPESSSFQLKKELRLALNHTVAASPLLPQKQQARVFAANIYARVKEYESANSALTHAINNDKNDDPRLRLMRHALREQWGDSPGVLEDLEALQDNQALKQQDPQAIANVRKQIEVYESRIKAERGPVYDAVIALRNEPGDEARRDAVAKAVEQTGPEEPNYDELVINRKVKPLYPEPTLETITRSLQNPDDFKLASDADPQGTSLHAIQARSAMQLKPGKDEQALIDRAYTLNNRLTARWASAPTIDRAIERHTQVINLYPDRHAYHALARLAYLAGDFDSAKRFGLIATGLTAVTIYEEPASEVGMGGATINPSRELARSADRLLNDKANPVEAALAKTCHLFEQGDFLAAGDQLEEAFKLDGVDPDKGIRVKNTVLENMQYEINRRYADQLLDAYVEAALGAKQAKDQARYEGLVKRIDTRYRYESHADSRVLLSEHALQSGDERMAIVHLDAALRYEPLNTWGHLVRGDRLSASGDTRQAMLHYNAAAGAGSATEQLEGRSKIAGQKRDQIEAQLGEPVNNLYGVPADAMRAENEEDHAGLIYGCVARMLREYNQNKNLLKMKLLAAYYMEDAMRAGITMKQLADQPVAPEIEAAELAWAYRLRGRTLIADNRDYTGAIAAYTASIEAKPDGVTYSARAMSFYELHWYDEAIADIDQVVEMKVATWSDYSVRAQSHEQLGNIEQAYADIQEALRLQKEADGKNNFGLSAVAQRISIKKIDALFGE